MSGSNKKSLFNIADESSFITGFLPGIKNEDWKYTNIKKFIPENICVQPFGAQNNKNLLENLKKNGHQSLPKKNVVFFLDGEFQQDLSDFPNGLKITKIQNRGNTVSSLYMDQLGENFNEHVDDSYSGFDGFLKNNKLVELNAYLTDSPYKLTFSQSYHSDQPLKIISGFSNNASFFNQCRLLFLIEKNTRVTLQEDLINFGEKNSVFNLVSEFICLEGSDLDFYLTQNDSKDSSIIKSVFCAQKKKSKTNFNIFSLSGRLIRNNFSVQLMESESSCNISGTSLLGGGDHLDNFITISHLVENCKSNQFFKSVYNEASSGAFCGKIYVEKGAQKTEAFQQNNNLMISKKASVNAKPQLEIFADDVVCSHGCTIGTIDEVALFYLRSRGIPEKEAVNLLIIAFLSELILRIENKLIRNELSALFLKQDNV